jgi:hypothetical protein
MEARHALWISGAADGVTGEVGSYVLEDEELAAEPAGGFAEAQDLLVLKDGFVDVNPDGLKAEIPFVIIKLLWANGFFKLAPIVIGSHLEYFVLRIERGVVFHDNADLVPQSDQ